MTGSSKFHGRDHRIGRNRTRNAPSRAETHSQSQAVAGQDWRGRYTAHHAHVGLYVRNRGRLRLDDGRPPQVTS